MSRELRNQKLFKGEKTTELIQRKNVLSLLYNTPNKNNTISKNQLNEIFNIYPNLKEIINVVDSFKKIFVAKRPDLLDKWLDKISLLNIKELTAFQKESKETLKQLSIQ